MKVLLLHDVYKLGHAGDIKKVADGYGRNYLIPQGFAMLATPGAIKQADLIRAKAAVVRSKLNTEMNAISEQINGTWLTFASKAGETGKLYGSITTQMIADALTEKTGVEIDKRQIDIQPIRTLGEHKAHIRLTVDIVPSIKVLVHREGEKPNIETVEASTEETHVETEAPAESEKAAE